MRTFRILGVVRITHTLKTTPGAVYLSGENGGVAEALALGPGSGTRLSGECYGAENESQYSYWHAPMSDNFSAAQYIALIHVVARNNHMGVRKNQNAQHQHSGHRRSGLDALEFSLHDHNVNPFVEFVSDLRRRSNHPEPEGRMQTARGYIIQALFWKNGHLGNHPSSLGCCLLFVKQLLQQLLPKALSAIGR